jgi:hypothetical protein
LYSCYEEEKARMKAMQQLMLVARYTTSRVHVSMHSKDTRFMRQN